MLGPVLAVASRGSSPLRASPGTLGGVQDPEGYEKRSLFVSGRKVSFSHQGSSHSAPFFVCPASAVHGRPAPARGDGRLTSCNQADCPTRSRPLDPSERHRLPKDPLADRCFESALRDDIDPQPEQGFQPILEPTKVQERPPWFHVHHEIDVARLVSVPLATEPKSRMLRAPCLLLQVKDLLAYARGCGPVAPPSVVSSGPGHRIGASCRKMLHHSGLSSVDAYDLARAPCCSSHPTHSPCGAVPTSQPSLVLPPG